MHSLFPFNSMGCCKCSPKRIRQFKEKSSMDDYCFHPFYRVYDLFSLRVQEREKIKINQTEQKINHKNLLLYLGRGIISAVFPYKCPACGSFFKPDNYAAMNSINNTVTRDSILSAPSQLSFKLLMDRFLCPSCSQDFLAVESPVCSKCGIMFKSREADDHICGECFDSPKNYGKARSSGIYERALMEVIHALKYRGRIEFARPLGLLLFSTFISHWGPQGIDLILPVPLHITRFRKRGFNQAFLLIRQWPGIAKNLGFMLSGKHINRDALGRSRNTGQQTGLDRTSRKKNMKKAFSLNRPELINGKRILLVDDVYTTGATVDECARILLLGGAKNVDVLTLAHTM